MLYPDEHFLNPTCEKEHGWILFAVSSILESIFYSRGIADSERITCGGDCELLVDNVIAFQTVT